MNKINKISIMGLGGIGATYASKLHDMDQSCLKVIVNKERKERYSKDGFIINDKKYNFNYIEPSEETKPADLIIMAVKFYHLEEAIKDIKNHVGPNTVILSLLNGISSEEIIGKEYGKDKVLYGMVLAIDAIREKNKITYADTATIHFGDQDNTTYSEKVAAVKELFERANIKYVIPENMLRTLWWKFMVNVGLNQITAVMKGTYKMFHEIEEAEKLLRETMMEAVILSQKIGVNLEEKDIDDYINLLKTLSPDGKTSMLQDIESGRKTEVEMLAGTICELGEKYKVETPINKMLLKMIRIEEKMNKIMK